MELDEIVRFLKWR